MNRGLWRATVHGVAESWTRLEHSPTRGIKIYLRFHFLLGNNILLLQAVCALPPHKFPYLIPFMLIFRLPTLKIPSANVTMFCSQWTVSWIFEILCHATLDLMKAYVGCDFV